MHKLVSVFVVGHHNGKPKLKTNNGETTIQVIKEANFIENPKEKCIDFGIGDETNLEYIRNNSNFYICFEEVEILGHSIAS